MTPPKTTIWKADPHTLAKHAILRKYLEAWFPILASANDRLVYIDGFAGPGRYSQGEVGSPVMALTVARDHFAIRQSELVFVFAEKDAERADWLDHQELPALNLPAHFKVRVRRGEFEEVLGGILDKLDSAKLQIAPTFAFVDPFGVKGLPFDLLRRLLARPKCEVLVTFMTSSIQRFVTELPDHINALVGRPDAATTIARAEDRVAMARRLYSESLLATARFVRFFQMRDDNDTPIYDLFFATNSPLGHERMKEAMWSVDTSGEYRFSDGVDPSQLTLFTKAPQKDLAELLRRKFQGRTTEWDEIARYTVDETAYLAKHARAALKLLEDVQRVTVNPLKRDGTKRRRGTFPSGTVIRFAS